MQLEMRLAEVTETLGVLRRLDAGDGADVARGNRCRNVQGRAEEWLPAWRDRLDLTDRVVIAGHSFGAATAVNTVPFESLAPSYTD